MSTDCQELGRVTKALVSAYTASRQETRRIRRFAKRCCVGQFNGSMPEGVTITSVRFETTSPWSILMSNPRIESTGRSAAVDVQFNFAGLGGLIITSTWSNGEVNNVEFWFTVIDTPLYPTAQYSSSNGPYRLDATA